MTPTGHFELSTQELDALALEFLGLEFTTQFHIDWPIERCVDAYLMHHGLSEVVNDGAAYNALLERVMVNIARSAEPGDREAISGLRQAARSVGHTDASVAADLSRRSRPTICGTPVRR